MTVEEAAQKEKLCETLRLSRFKSKKQTAVPLCPLWFKNLKHPLKHRKTNAFLKNPCSSVFIRG